MPYLPKLFCLTSVVLNECKTAGAKGQRVACHCMRVSGATWTLLAVSAGTLAGILYIHEGQRQEREVGIVTNRHLVHAWPDCLQLHASACCV